jgi:transketolase
VTLHEALAAAKQLETEGTKVRVIDLFSIKPVDKDELVKTAQ